MNRQFSEMKIWMDLKHKKRCSTYEKTMNPTYTKEMQIKAILTDKTDRLNIIKIQNFGASKDTNKKMQIQEQTGRL